MRPSGRAPDELRPVRITRGYTRHAEGSVLVEFGDTKVLCTASVEERVPAFQKERGQGWLTAEYGMLPRATNTRTDREASRGRQSGRTLEIQRLIGRSLRAVTALAKLGPRTIQVDCDVIQADGGTRTASITGAFVAVHDAVSVLTARGLIAESPIEDFVAAVSVGVYQGVPVLDLDYPEDSACDTDMNVVMTGAGGFVTPAKAGVRELRHGVVKGLLDAGFRRHDGPLKDPAYMSRLVLASSNPGKLREFGELLAPLGFEVVPQGALGVPDAEEPHATFVENALVKARNASRHSKLPALADDSGICVAALDGEPGVHSARFAGEPKSDERNNEKLVRLLADKPDRRAHYYCVVVFVRHADDPEPLIAEGRWQGEVIDTPRGAGGFGYDPYFLLPDLGRTAAELEPREKHAVSHRGKALRRLLALLREAD